MKKILTLFFSIISIAASAQVMQLDTVGNACHINAIGFAKDNMTYTLVGDSSITLYVVAYPSSYNNVIYSRFRDPSGSSFANRQALTDWLDTYFFADAAASDTSSGGGSVGTLQEVTDSGNSTSNVIQITGLGSYNPGLNSLLFGVAGGSAFLQNQQSGIQSNINLAADGSMVFNTWNSIGSSTAQVMKLYNDFQGSSSTAVEFAGRVKITEAIESNDAISLGQIQALQVGGIDTFIADAITTVFDITTNAGFIPSWFTLSTTNPITQNQLNRTITFPDNNTIRITFNVAPLIGENVYYVWSVHK